jgi:hypothetical protein
MVWWSMLVVTFIGTAGYFDPPGALHIVAALAQVPDKFFEMIAAGTGAYVIGRSTEKVATAIPYIIAAIKKKL